MQGHRIPSLYVEDVGFLLARLDAYEEHVTDPAEVAELKHILHQYDGTAIKLNEANKEIARLRAALKPIEEVWEKFKHLDALLSDEEWLGEGPLKKCLYDLWQAVRKAVAPE